MHPGVKTASLERNLQWMPTRSKSSKAAKETESVDDLVLRSLSWLHFSKKPWATDSKLLGAFIDAVSQTSAWEVLSLLSIGGAPGKPRGKTADIKAAIQGSARFAFIDRGKNIYSDDTTASVEVQITARAATIKTATCGKVLADLGSAALDDFYTMLRSLHDSLGKVAHLISATAWTDWSKNTPSTGTDGDWPLRAVADIVEPSRAKEDERDVFWDVAQAIAKAPLPKDVKRSRHGELLELRWLADASDGHAADAAAVRHEEWLGTFLKPR